MCLLFETIACNNGQLQNLEWHEKRLNNSRLKKWNNSNYIKLDFIPLPDFVQKGTWKCKVLYQEEIVGVAFESYQPKNIRSFKIVESTIEYEYKYLDRTEINKLYQRKGDADEIIIVKDGFITDTSIGNILLYNGQIWVTPENPLLPGTMRAKLLESGTVRTGKIPSSQLRNYEEIMVVNALQPFDINRSLKVTSIQL